MKQIIEFYKKNRLLILGGLIVILVLQWCQHRSDILYRSGDGVAAEQVITVPNPSEADEPMIDPEMKDDRPIYNPWISYLIMVGLVLLVFVAQRRGWLEKMIPAMVLMRISVFKNRKTKRRMMQFFFMNTTKSGQTFDAPIVEFLKFGSVKSYRINVNNNAYSFPITLTNNTSHKVVIDLDQFYDKVDDLKSYKWVRAKVMVNGVAVKKTLPRPVF